MRGTIWVNLDRALERLVYARHRLHMGFYGPAITALDEASRLLEEIQEYIDGLQVKQEKGKGND